MFTSRIQASGNSSILEDVGRVEQVSRKDRIIGARNKTSFHSTIPLLFSPGYGSYNSISIGS